MHRYSKNKRWKKLPCLHQKKRNTRVIILIFGHVDFIERNITRVKKEHFILIEGLIHQEEIPIPKKFMHVTTELQNI